MSKTSCNFMNLGPNGNLGPPSDSHPWARAARRGADSYRQWVRTISAAQGASRRSSNALGRDP
eukprot:673923-Prymnesium_polylepis.1